MIGRCIGSAKRSNTKLLTLNLSNNKIQDEGLLAIAEVREITLFIFWFIAFNRWALTQHGIILFKISVYIFLKKIGV